VKRKAFSEPRRAATQAHRSMSPYSAAADLDGFAIPLTLDE
jgi:hypothetical protein